MFVEEFYWNKQIYYFRYNYILPRALARGEIKTKNPKTALAGINILGQRYNCG